MLGMYEKILYTLKQQTINCELGCFGSKQVSMVSSIEHDNEHEGSVSIHTILRECCFIELVCLKYCYFLTNVLMLL